MSNSTSSSEVSDSLTIETAWSIHHWIIQEAIEGLFYGIECILTFSALYFIFYRGSGATNLSRKLMACALILMLIGSTACYASGMIWNNIQIWQMAYPELDPFKTLYNMNIINIVFPRMTYILGDMIVVWRAWILYDSKPLIRIFLAFCITTVLVVSVVDSVLTTVNVDAVLADVPLIFGLMLPVTLLFTNLSATLLIGYKVWHYRKFVKIHLGNFSPSTQVERILIILVESGAFYCCLWVLVILTKNLSSANIQIHAYLGILMPHMASIYPTLIILTTMRQKSHGDSTLHDVLSGPIIFASGNESVSATPNTPGLTSTKSKQEVYMMDTERGLKLNPEAEPQVPIVAQDMNSNSREPVDRMGSSESLKNM